MLLWLSETESLLSPRQLQRGCAQEGAGRREGGSGGCHPAARHGGVEGTHRSWGEDEWKARMPDFEDEIWSAIPQYFPWKPGETHISIESINQYDCLGEKVLYRRP